MIEAGRRKFSVKTRIIFLVVMLIIGIFLIIAGLFNFLMNNYIQSSATRQLQGVRVFIQGGQWQQPIQLRPNFSTGRYNNQAPGGQTSPGNPSVLYPDLSTAPRGLGGRAEMLVISQDYELVYPSANSNGVTYQEAQALFNQLKKQNVDLSTGEITHLKAPEGEFYMLSMPAVLAQNQQMHYIVSYVNMTPIVQFTAGINLMLIIVMLAVGLAAAMVAVLFSGRIAEPIRELSAFAKRIGEGNFTQSRYNYHDRELSELADSMNKAAGQLESYDSDQKTFFQNVSHELRTPLQSIRSNAEGIGYGILEQQKASHVIVAETDRLGEMIDDLLYLSRMDNITQAHSQEIWDLRELLSSSAENQRSVAVGKGVEFLFQFGEQPVELLCDEKQISRAFSNLISNAVRYAHSRITLSCQMEQERVIASVADDGDGITSEDLPHIFDRFYKGKDGKHGIGLSIVKSVVDQHHGQIDVSSTPKGTVFTISFARPHVQG